MLDDPRSLLGLDGSIPRYEADATNSDMHWSSMSHFARQLEASYGAIDAWAASPQAGIAATLHTQHRPTESSVSSRICVLRIKSVLLEFDQHA